VSLDASQARRMAGMGQAWEGHSRSGECDV
jgi:hypothetical protein